MFLNLGDFFFPTIKFSSSLMIFVMDVVFVICYYKFVSSKKKEAFDNIR